MSGMQQRTFEFGDGQTARVTVWCRAPPESQAGRTLTWQCDDAPSSADRSQGGSASAAPSAAASAASTVLPPPAAGSEAAPDLIGLDLWPASIALCSYLASHAELVSGAAVLELGAGMGLVGLLCARLGAAQVLLTDYEPVVVAQLAANAELNGVVRQCATLVLDWRDAAAALAPQQQGTWRRVVASDVLYAGAVVQPLVSTLHTVLHPEGVALIGHQVRRAIMLDRATRLPRLEDADEPLEAFKAACAAAGLPLRVLSTRPTCSNRDTDPMVLLAVGGGPAAQLGGLPALA